MKQILPIGCHLIPSYCTHCTWIPMHLISHTHRRRRQRGSDRPNQRCPAPTPTFKRRYHPSGITKRRARPRPCVCTFLPNGPCRTPALRPSDRCDLPDMAARCSDSKDLARSVLSRPPLRNKTAWALVGAGASGLRALTIEVLTRRYPRIHTGASPATRARPPTRRPVQGAFLHSSHEQTRIAPQFRRWSLGVRRGGRHAPSGIARDESSVQGHRAGESIRKACTLLSRIGAISECSSGAFPRTATSIRLARD
ncbi:hypothetical protein OF83DRAFT_194934 [Amylostereum chailletii]|nr:hypothetical protein OF83DRAFT_194934 [Amylostereum chailletii]